MVAQLRRTCTGLEPMSVAVFCPDRTKVEFDHPDSEERDEPAEADGKPGRSGACWSLSHVMVTRPPRASGPAGLCRTHARTRRCPTARVTFPNTGPSESVFE